MIIRVHKASFICHIYYILSLYKFTVNGKFSIIAILKLMPFISINTVHDKNLRLQIYRIQIINSFKHVIFGEVYILNDVLFRYIYKHPHFIAPRSSLED